MLTGIRKDAYAENARIPVEENKSESERGHYLHPAAFGKPREEGAALVNHPKVRKVLMEQNTNNKQ